MPRKPEKRLNVILSPADIAKVEATVERAIQVAEDLYALTEEENRRLKSGRPATIDDLLERKQKLATELEAFLKSFKAQSNVFLLASPEKFTRLQHSNEKLTRALSENSQNLVRALTANRRRVETIREKQAANTRYDKTGSYGSQPSGPLSIGRRYEV
jgi:flagellar biosynthesis/type III secretory pathway chaperone